MSNSDKSKKGLIANIRRKASFKKEAPADSVAPSVDTTNAEAERMEQDRERILTLERELEAARKEVQIWEKKATQYENASADLDDDSYGAAQEFQLKKELTEIQKELAAHEEMKQELADAKQQIAELNTQNEELQLQQSRKSTRTDMQRIRVEKSTREEVERLQREIRQMERNAKSQASLVEAQLKASKDSLQRAGEKAQALQRRLDLVDKERLDLKLENQRLGRKLEKSDSYEAKKRAQMEAESQQMEIANLKRKTIKLEKRLSLSTMNLSEIDELAPLNISSPTRTDSRMSSEGSSSPPPMTLSEARIEKLEKEVHTLEEQNSALATQNETLRDELSAAQQKSTILISQVEQLQAGINEEKKETEEVLSKLPQYQNSPSLTTDGSTQQSDGEPQEEIAKLKKALEDKETEMRVRLKEMKATNEELKKQVEELEMEKLRLELREDEEGEATDTEENGKEDETEQERLASLQDVKATKGDEADVGTMRERLMSLQDELLFVTQNNDELKTKLEKQKEETELFIKSIENELSDVQVKEEEKTREQKLAERNEELKRKLKEQQNMYDDMVRENSHLKDTIKDKVCYLHSL